MSSWQLFLFNRGELLSCISHNNHQCIFVLVAPRYLYSWKWWRREIATTTTTHCPHPKLHYYHHHSVLHLVSMAPTNQHFKTNLSSAVGRSFFSLNFWITVDHSFFKYCSSEKMLKTNINNAKLSTSLFNSFESTKLQHKTPWIRKKVLGRKINDSADYKYDECVPYISYPHLLKDGTELKLPIKTMI